MLSVQGDLHLDTTVEQALGAKAMESLKRELHTLIEMYMIEGEEKKGAKNSIDIEQAGVHGDISLTTVSASLDKSKIVHPIASTPNISGTTISFTNKIGPHDKNAFAAELLEIITTATSFFNT